MEKIIIQDWNPLNWRLEKIPAGKTVELHLPDAGSVSDGFHSFDELYEQRNRIWIALCHTIREWQIQEGTRDDKLDHQINVWRSKLHSDGGSFEGWFLLGIGKDKGSQRTQHLPMNMWDETNFAETLERGPEFDGHTPADVLERLKDL